MEVIHSFEQLNIQKKTAIAVGYFDGMHLGHRTLISEMVRFAEEENMIPMLLTFDMSELRAEGKGKKDLFPREHTLETAEMLGVEVYTEIRFGDIKDMSPAEFCKRVLADQNGLKAGAVFCGEDFRFGKDRAGTVEDLKKYGDELGYTAEVIDDIYISGEIVSTSRIKEAMEEGDVQTANLMLGAPYSVKGEVIHGNHLAQGLGFPTANQRYPSNMTVPKKGVYLTETVIDGTRYRSITNVGTRPTVTEDLMATAETHILDFSGDLYGKVISVLFFEFIRPEQKFESIDELRETVLRDIRFARENDPAL